MARRWLAGIFVLATLSMCGGWPAFAQQAAPAAPAAPAKTAPSATQEAAPNRAEIESLIRTLDDDRARADLVAKLRVLIAVQKKPAPLGLGARLMDDVSGRIEAIGQGFVQVGEQISRPDLFVTWLRQQVHSPSRRLFWARVFAILAGALAAALTAGFVVRRILARPRQVLERRPYPNPLGRLLAAVGRTLLDCAPIVAFAAAGYGVLAVTGPVRLVRLVALAVLNAAILVQLVVAGCRLVLAPLASNLRLLPMTDETAAYAYIWVRRFAIVAIYGYFAGQLSLLVRLSEAGHQAIVKLIGALVAIMMAILILQMRPRIGDFIRGGAAGVRPRFDATRARIADIWHILAIALIFAAYFTWALAVRGGIAFLLRGLIGTAIVVIVARLLVALEHRLLDQLFEVSADFRARYPTLEERASRYVPIVSGLVTTLVVVAAIICALQTWGIDSVRALESPMGRAVALGLLRILVIVVIAVAVIEGVGLAVARYLHTPDPTGHIRERSARVRTLLPLLRNVLAILVGTVAAISVLSQFGVDIAPLIAGVGIFGLAVGFGAQSLVKDVITGAFILFEDTIAVGDVIEVGSHSGTVEALSIRSVRMRDLSGHVHTVPFGTIDAVVNSTRDFANYVADVGIAYREDTDAVAAILTQVVEEMRADDAFAQSILAPLEVMGVQSLADFSVVLRVRIRTLPLDQWRVGREFNRRLKKAFDANDIEIPFPTRTLYFGVAKDGTAPPARVALREDGPQPEAARPVLDAPRPSDAEDGGEGGGNGQPA